MDLSGSCVSGSRGVFSIVVVWWDSRSGQNISRRDGIHGRI